MIRLFWAWDVWEPRRSEQEALGLGWGWPLWWERREKEADHDGAGGVQAGLSQWCPGAGMAGLRDLRGWPWVGALPGMSLLVLVPLTMPTVQMSKARRREKLGHIAHQWQSLGPHL